MNIILFQGLYMPTKFMPLNKLRELRLDHNKLHTLNQNIFEHAAFLEILDLSYNPFKIIDHHTLVAIDSLTRLKVRKYFNQHLYSNEIVFWDEC